MRHAQFAALADRCRDTAIAATREHQMGNVARGWHSALPVNHSKVQGLLYQHRVQVSHTKKKKHLDATQSKLYKYILSGY